MRLKWYARQMPTGEKLVEAPQRVDVVAHPARGVAQVPAGEQVTIYRRPLLTRGQAHAYRVPTSGRRT